MRGIWLLVLNVIKKINYCDFGEGRFSGVVEGVGIR